jgi:hypothetical protein
MSTDADGCRMSDDEHPGLIAARRIAAESTARRRIV